MMSCLKKIMSKFGETGEYDTTRKRTKTNFKWICRKVSLTIDVIDLSFTWFAIWKAVRSIINWYPYNIHFVQELNPADPNTRAQFARMFFTRITVDNAWPWSILWSEDTHFTQYGAVKSENCHIWGTVSPNVVQEQSLHSDYIAGWSGCTTDFILGHFV